jgi:hypothetical protein
MIADPAVKAELSQEWSVVEGLRNWSHGYLIPGGGYVNETPPIEFYNLPLVLAYCALDDFLIQCTKENFFPAPARNQLGARMHASISAISWVDSKLVDQGRTARNDLAHKAKIVTKADCLKYIDAIGSEFRSWGIIP